MDGIFGVGVAEILIIALALFVIGGPKNAATWARDMGRMVRQVRLAWAQMMAELEHDLGPDGKELMDAARELGKGAREVSSMAHPTRLVGDTLRMVESAVDIDAVDSAPAAETPSSATQTPAAPETSTNGKKYSAWLPPEKQ